jgi:DNA-binding HxlR family transcriptional regulator
MYLYGQYCPVARASEILADRWTPLIVRELLAGLRHFNDLDRGLPGISRALLVERLRRLERMGVVERHASPRAGASSMRSLARAETSSGSSTSLVAGGRAGRLGTRGRPSSIRSFSSGG